CAVKFVGYQHRVLRKERRIAASNDVQRAVQDPAGPVECAVSVEICLESEVRTQPGDRRQSGRDLCDGCGVEQSIGVVLSQDVAVQRRYDESLVLRRYPASLEALGIGGDEWIDRMRFAERGIDLSRASCVRLARRGAGWRGSRRFLYA